MKIEEHIEVLNETIKELHQRNNELIAIIKEDNLVIKNLLRKIELERHQEEMEE